MKCLNSLTCAATLIFLLCFTLSGMAEITIIDDSGSVVILEKPAQRIVSLAPNITESLFAIGVGNRIIATVKHSDYPDEALKIPVIGTYKNINLESVFAAQPDLVIAWGEGNEAGMIKSLRDLGLNVYVSDPKSLQDITKNLKSFSRLTDAGDTGQRASESFQNTLNHLKSRYKNTEPVTVFYQVWNQPLLTINGRHLISEVISLCGGVNVFNDALPLIPIIGVESVLSENPQVIIVSGHGEERPDWLNDWRKLPLIDAVERNHLFYIPPGLLQRHSTRIIKGAELMCEFFEKVRKSEKSSI